ncbi:MAG TPA: protein-glutamate O-methyltransferase CheR [Gammaproteobacteria bacterium]|nr:protein-glutamate O-methyltransferase CheR [Gammaproteobacteria bacterium]
MKPNMEYLPGYEELAVKRLPQMEPEQFQQWAALLKQRTGMRLPDNRTSFLATNLGMRMRELGINDYQTYFDFVQKGREGAIEWDRLVHHLTVHETRFLRQESVISLICEEHLPACREQCSSPALNIDVWSVGCSTGEEPYSIAMAIDDHMQQMGCQYYLGITASDISRSALAHGRKGIYSRQQVKNIEPRWLDNYFSVTDDEKFQVNEDLRKRVCFNHLNILDIGAAPIGMMDIIVCQNLLIYFDKEQRIAIANTLAAHLKPGGLLILGVGELLNWKHPELTRFTYANTLAFKRQAHLSDGQHGPDA